MTINKKIAGFTLLELLIAMIIFAVLAGMISASVFSSLKKGRDGRRKTDLEQIQKAIEMYYEDKKSYPNSITFGGQITDSVTGKVYMQKVPADPSVYHYQYCVDSTSQKYQLYAYLENNQDKSIITPTKLSPSTCTADCPNCNYGITSSDTSP